MLKALGILCILGGIGCIAYGSWGTYMYYKNHEDPLYSMHYMLIFVSIFCLALGIFFITMSNDHYTEYLEWKESYRDEHYSLPQWVEDTTYEQWCAQRGYKVNEQNRR